MNHAAPPTPSRYKTKEKTPEATSKTDSKKRAADESPGDEKQALKKVKTKRVRKSKSPDAEEGSSPAEAETRMQLDPALQVCRYLLEMFSVPLLRSHATVCLVDRDRLQLYHGNRSVILVLSAINFSSGDGLDKFIALVIAFRCLSLTQSGILESFVDENTELVTDPEVERDYKLIHMENKIKISHEPEKQMTLTMGRVISRDPSAIGRSTTVAQAKSDAWPDDNLVIKISWPTSGRVPETTFLQKAAEEAEKSDGKWAVKHLPRVYFAKDADFGECSTFAMVEKLFKDAKFAGGDFVYERRDLRIIVQEELYPLKSLTNARDMGQVFVDIACSM